MNEDAHSALRNDLAVILATLDLVEAEPAISAELRHFVGSARERLFTTQLPAAMGLDENGRCAEADSSVSGG